MKLKKFPYNKILLAESVLNDLNHYRQRINEPETGGILLGKILANGNIIICNCSRPCISGKAYAVGFERSSKLANQIIRQFFNESNGTIVYVGEWHTHPENVPSPSATDLKSIKNIYNTTNLNSDIIVYIIIGPKSEYYGCYDGQMHYIINPIYLHHK